MRKKRINKRRVGAMVVSLLVFVGAITLIASLVGQVPLDEEERDELEEQEDTRGEMQIHMEDLFSECYYDQNFERTQIDYQDDALQINITVSERDRDQRVGDSVDCTEIYFGNVTLGANLTFFDEDGEMYQRLIIDG